MKEIDIYQVEAFTDRLFEGNTAAVCPLKKWLQDIILQSIAAENNLSETAFFIPTQDGFELRWFTPKVEIDLCGHATLAASHVIFNHLKYPKDKIEFGTRLVGPLSVTRNDDFLTLDFPSWTPESITIPEAGIAGLNGFRPRGC